MSGAFTTGAIGGDAGILEMLLMKEILKGALFATVPREKRMLCESEGLNRARSGRTPGHGERQAAICLKMY